MTQDSPSSAAELNAAQLVTELEQALQATLFSCTGRITPRRVKQIAQEMAEAFIQFAQNKDPAMAEREALLLQEQERTRQAAERAQAHNR